MKTASSAPIRMAGAPQIIFVHGGWADGSCWSRVIPMLQRAGYSCWAVQLPISSFEADVAALDRLIGRVSLPTILVGHSYGGAVISAARPDSIAGLIYVAATAPDRGEALGSLMTRTPAPRAVLSAPDEGGYIWATDRMSFRQAMADDLPEEEADLLFACQTPIHNSLLGASLPDPAWKRGPTRYLVAKADQMFAVETQAFLADRMKAETSWHDCGHMMPLSRPDAIVEAVIAMAQSDGGQ